jgi:hypothetical protein
MLELMKTLAEKGTKVCRNCHRELPLEDFYAQKGNRDGHRNVCKHCYVERAMQTRLNDPDHKVRHRERGRTPRRANGQGDRHEYHAKRYAENRDAIKVRNIERQLGRPINEMPKPKPKPVKVRMCENECANWPCFDGIENLETDFAREGCHAFRQRGEAS